MTGTTRLQSENEIDVTPLLDVVFILLIFFIVTTSFARESGVELSRPGSAPEASDKRAQIAIGVHANGEVWLQGRRIEPASAAANIARLLGEHPDSGLVIVADQGAPTGILVTVLDQVRRAGGAELSVAVVVDSETAR